jgi:aspartate 1-decarboxylase
MQRFMHKSKIHRATVTECNLHYEGSITIDEHLMEAANLLPNEKVMVVNINTGARFETYVITGAPHSGEICLNGAAARLVERGDKVIIISFASYDEAELAEFAPTVVRVDDDNHMLNDKRPERRRRGTQIRVAN